MRSRPIRRPRPTRSSLIAIAVLGLTGSAATAQQRRPMTFDDFISLRTLGDPQISPDGALIAFTVGTASLGDDRNVSKIWIVPADGGEAKALTTGAGSDRAPRWSPDGKTLTFLSTRDGAAQVWRVAPRGGEPVKVTTMPAGVNDYGWSPDGKALYLIADTKWPIVQEIDRRSDQYPTQARIFTSLFFRHWNEWRAGLRQHLFRYSLTEARSVDLTPIDRDVPTLALGGHDLAISSVGTEVAVTFNPDSSIATSTNNDVFVMGPDGAGRQAITTNKANDNSPAYSPDGRYIAYLSSDIPGFESDQQHLTLYERATGRRTPLTASWDVSIAAFSWAPDSRSVVAEVEERGERVLYAVEIPTGRPTRLVSGAMNTNVQVSPAGDYMIFLRQSAVAPPELYRTDPVGRGMKQLTRINSAVLSRLTLPALEPFGFVGAAGDSVFGWVMRPPGFDARKSYPLVYLIHGGPQGAWLDQWHARWNYAMFASQGYVVAAVNFHGSTGYGRRFTNSISRNWGGLPYDDLMKGLDVLATRSYVDKDRMGAAGASYGGYMIYWMAGHTTRFRALVAHDGVFNPLSMAGTTEELWFPIWEFGGSQLSPSARAIMEKWSPANFIGQWTTPLLVVHSQLDYRLDLSEGLQAFTAAKLRGLPAKFLYFPDEDHFVTRPRNRRLWWDTVLDWLDTYLRRSP